MKFVLILASIFVTSNALDKEFVDKFMTEVRTVGEQCITETSATKEDLDNLMEHQIPDSHEGKCMLFCFHKHFHIQNQDGSLNKPGAIDALEPLKKNDPKVYTQVLKIFTTCGDEAETDSDPCVYATNLVECALKEGKAIGLKELLMVE